MLLENSGCKKCSLETVNSSRANHTTKSTHRVAGRFCVIRKIIEPSLNRCRRAQLIDELSFCW